MSDRLNKSNQMTLWDSIEFISLPELPAGKRLCVSPDGEAEKCGPEARLVSPSHRRESKKATPTRGISGLNSCDLSKAAGPPSYSASKSPQVRSSDLQQKTRTCRKCGIEKPYAAFYVNSKGNRRRACMECDRASERLRKRGKLPRNAALFKQWRLEKRGHALTVVAKHRAKKRGLPFDLSAENIQARISSGFCEMTGIPFNLSTPRSWDAPSLDRIDSTKGYTTDNVRVVLYALNVMANTWGPNRIVEIANAIMHRRRAASDNLSNRLAEKLKARFGTDGSMEYSQTWKRRVTPVGRSYWAHTASARRTSDSVCTGWGTPRAGETGRHRSPEAIAKARLRGGSVALEDQAHLAGWNTPHTPRAHDSDNSNTSYLGRQAALVASGPCSHSSPAETESKGALNPEFSRWLMGFRAEWGCSGATAMQSMRTRRQRSSKR